MINLELLYKQHGTVSAEIQTIQNEAANDAASLNAATAALHISLLAGQLKVHLLQEDKFMYPILMKSADFKLKELANIYMAEMGNLADEYTKYKNSYNTKNKILDNINSFKKDTLVIMELLQRRIDKENHELYELIYKKGA